MDENMIDGSEFDLTETPMSGANATGAVTPPPATNAGTMIDIMSRVGSQGAPVPSNALDAQQRTTEISKALAGYAKGLTANQGGYGDIASALAATVAGRGKTGYGQAMEDLQNQRITRAYNIANAMAGLGRQGTAGQLTEYQRLQIDRGKTEDAARDRREWGTRTDAMIRSAVSNLDNPSEGIAFFQKRMQELGATRDTPIADLERISRQVFSEFPRQGFAGKRGRDEDGAGELTGGPVRDAEGNLIGWEPWKRTRGRLTTEQEKQNQVWISSQGRPMAERLGVMADVVSFAQGGAAGVTAATQRRIAGYSGAVAKTKSALNVVDRLNQLLDDPRALTGAAGAASIVAEGLRSQAAQVSRILSSGVEVKNENNVTIDKIPASAFRDAKQVNELWDRYAPADTKGLLGNLVAGSEAAQRIRTNTLILAFAVAGAAEPGGRISDNDVKRMTQIIGAGQLTSPANMKAALNEVSRWMRGRVDAEYNEIFEGLPPSQRDRISPPGFGAAQPAAAPADASVSTPKKERFERGPDGKIRRVD